MPFTGAQVITRLSAHGEPHDRIDDPRTLPPGARDEFTPTPTDVRTARAATLG